MNFRHQERIGFLCLVGAIGLWSTVEVVVRAIHDAVPPIQLAWARFLIGAFILLLLLPADLRRRNLRLTPSILGFCAWVALPGIAVSGMALQFSLQRTGAATVATVYGAAPLFVMALSRVLLGDPFTARRAAGLLCGLTGIAILSLGRHSAHFSPEGVFWAIVAAAAFAFWTVMVKKSAGAFAGLPVTALCCLFGVLYLSPPAFLESGGLQFGALRQHALPVLYLGLGGTGLAYWLYFRGLEHVDATRAASIILLKPPAATLLAALCLGEPLTWNLLAAMALIAAALYIVFMARPAGPRRSEESPK